MSTTEQGEWDEDETVEGLQLRTEQEQSLADTDFWAEPLLSGGNIEAPDLTSPGESNSASQRSSPSDEGVRLAWRAVDDAYQSELDEDEQDVRIAEARRQVEEAYDAEDAELLPHVGDSRQMALDAFELDPESTRQAEELGKQLARDLPQNNWEEAGTEHRDEAARRFGLDVSEQLDLPPISPILDPDMPHNKLGVSRGEQVFLNRDLIDNPEPRELIETTAHEYRHQWQERVVNGELKHPGGDDAFFKLVAGSISYASDYERESKYNWNGYEIDAEKFARIVSAAYNAAQYKR